MSQPLALAPAIQTSPAEVAADSVGLGVFFAIGVLGGAHCLGMCGPLVTTYGARVAGDTDRVGWRDVRQHALFNLGRVASYATVGAALGAAGAGVYDAATLLSVADGVRGVAGVGVGLFILATGARYLLGGRVGGPDALPGGRAPFERLSGWLFARVDSLVRGPRILALGSIHAVLPCPLLFPAYLYAFARGSPVEGALALAALGVGTAPTMFALGALSASLNAGHRASVHRALGVAFLGLGLVALTHGLGLFGLPVPRIPLPIYQPLP